MLYKVFSQCFLRGTKTQLNKNVDNIQSLALFHMRLKSKQYNLIKVENKQTIEKNS